MECDKDSYGKVATGAGLHHAIKRVEPQKEPGLQSCGFLALPFELRTQIYHSLFVNADTKDNTISLQTGFSRARNEKIIRYARNDPYVVNLSCSFPSRQRLGVQKLRTHSGLLRTCTVIHDEVAQVIYGENTFEFSGRERWLDFTVFCSHLTDVSRRSLRRVVINFSTCGPFQHPYLSEGSPDFWLEWLPRICNLQTLTLCVDRDLGRSDMETLQYIDECKGGCNVRLSLEKEPVPELYRGEFYSRHRPYLHPTLGDEIRAWGWEIDEDVTDIADSDQ